MSLRVVKSVSIDTVGIDIATSRHAASTVVRAPCAAVRAGGEKRCVTAVTSRLTSHEIRPAVIASTMANDADHVQQADRAVLFAALHNVDHVPRFLAGPVATAASRTNQALRIVLVSPLFDSGSAGLESHRPTALGTKRFDDVQSILTYVYVQATKVAQEMGKILMDVDVLLKGEDEPLQESITAGAEIIYQGEQFNISYTTYITEHAL